MSEQQKVRERREERINQLLNDLTPSSATDIVSSSALPTAAPASSDGNDNTLLPLMNKLDSLSAEAKETIEEGKALVGQADTHKKKRTREEDELDTEEPPQSYRCVDNKVEGPMPPTESDEEDPEL